jgi:fido (protein-threonine AMPylation protein)
VSQSRIIETEDRGRKYAIERTRVTAAIATMARMVVIHRFRVGSGRTHAAAARMMANPIWIHSETLIDASEF